MKKYKLEELSATAYEYAVNNIKTIYGLSIASAIEVIKKNSYTFDQEGKLIGR